jgi:hypothetical protein
MTALITGASVGIGRELARIFAENGHDLVLVARSVEQLNQVAAECQSLGHISARVLPKDLSIPIAPREIFDELNCDGVTIDVLVNNAGFGNYGPFAEVDLDADLGMLQVNIVALTALTKLFLPGMLSRRSGRIMNVASMAAFQPGPFMSTYYASKAYVLHLSEAIASECAGRGVVVSALCPGPVKTEFQSRAGIVGSRLFKGKATMDARTVALDGYRGLMRGRRVVVPGISNKVVVQLTRVVPRRLTTFIAGKMNKVH